MKPVRAFVGHSFTEDDEVLVGRFTKHFDQLSELQPNFSWQHAERPEPKDLAEKVLQLIEGKNLFIGICTKKERVIAPSALSNAWFPFDHLMARKTDILWKTSDWIIQEIGLAIGRGLKLILLIEDGLRLPGGLQGNIEYITFFRDAPEKSFEKITRMITALSPRLTVSTTDASQEESTTSEEMNSVERAPIGSEWTIPKQDWTKEQYEFAYRYLILTDKESDASLISNAYLATGSGSVSPHREGWEAYREYVQITYGKGGDLSRLKRLAEKHPSNVDVVRYLAKGYGAYKQHAVSADLFENAASLSTEMPTKLQCLRESAMAYQKAANPEATSAIVEQLKRVVTDSGQWEEELLLVERGLAEAENLNEVLVGVLERLIEINPSDNDTRFSLAYKYSELGLESLALLHYGSIPYGDRSGNTWNNLGVAYDQLALPAKSVSAYRQAEEAGETIAMSNLANKFIIAGFLSEAEKLTETAMKEEKYHKNVVRTVTRLREVPEEETKKVEELLIKARRISAFESKLGAAVAKITPDSIGDLWEGPSCTLEVTWTKRVFHGIGYYMSRSFGIMSNPYIGGDKANRPPKRYVVEYRAEVHGRALIGTVTERIEGTATAASSLLAIQKEPKVLMVLADDGSEIQVLEQPNTGEAKYYSLRLAQPK